MAESRFMDFTDPPDNLPVKLPTKHEFVGQNCEIFLCIKLVGRSQTLCHPHGSRRFVQQCIGQNICQTIEQCFFTCKAYDKLKRVAFCDVTWKTNRKKRKSADLSPFAWRHVVVSSGVREV